MIPRHFAHTLLRKWASAEQSEVSHVDFPRVSPMFRDYQSGYRATIPDSEEDLIPEKVGIVLQDMHPALSRTLRRYYFEGKRGGRRAYSMAMSDFCKRWDSHSNEPANHFTFDAAIP